MKRRSWLVAAVCAGLCTSLEYVRAEEPGDEAPGRKPRFERGRPGGRGQDPVRTEMRFAGQLREAVMAELELTDDQKTSVQRIFQEHSEAIQKAARAPREEEADASIEERQAELERQAQAAREAGDMEAARRIRREMVELRRGRGQANPEEVQRLHQEFVDTLQAELTEEQSVRFDQIVERLEAQADSGESIMLLMQAGRRASMRMELDEEQRRRVNEAVRNAVRESVQDGGRGQDPAAVMQSLRAEITAVLGEEQGQQFMEALEREKEAMSGRNPPVPDEQPAEAAPARPDGEQPDGTDGD